MKKDYLNLFLTHCKDHNTWFSVCTDGSIDQCTHCECDVDFEPNRAYMLGSKACYEWLVREVAVIESNP
jgi:hypothetical protein